MLGRRREGVNVGKLGFEDGLKLGGSDELSHCSGYVGVGASVGDDRGSSNR